MWVLQEFICGKSEFYVECLYISCSFAAEIQDLLSWLGEVDGIIAASKPVGGLPETASEQLERFMVSVYFSKLYFVNIE